MKICHFTSVHRYDDTRIFIKECHALAKEFETHLVAVGAPTETIDGIHIHGIEKMATNRLQRMIGTVWNVYKKAIQINADVYHFHDPELLPIGLVLKMKKKKVVYDVHEDVPEQILSKHWIPTPLKKPISFFVNLFEKFAARRFDGIVTATPEIKELFDPYNPNVVSVQNFPIMDEWEAVSTNNEGPQNKIVYVGSITKPRGIMEMVLAMEEVNKEIDAELLLGGSFSSESLKEEIEGLAGWQYVNYLSWLGREEIRNVFLQSSIGLVLIHPEKRYQVSYPVKLFEYMSAGLPVIVSNFPLWRSIVEGNNCGICVDPLNPKEVADAMYDILTNQEKAKEMGLNGRRAVEEKYSWQAEEKKLIVFYKGLSKMTKARNQNGNLS